MALTIEHNLQVRPTLLQQPIRRSLSRRITTSPQVLMPRNVQTPQRVQSTLQVSIRRIRTRNLQKLSRRLHLHQARLTSIKTTNTQHTVNRHHRTRRQIIRISQRHRTINRIQVHLRIISRTTHISVKHNRMSLSRTRTLTRHVPHLTETEHHGPNRHQTHRLHANTMNRRISLQNANILHRRFSRTHRKLSTNNNVTSINRMTRRQPHQQPRRNSRRRTATNRIPRLTNLNHKTQRSIINPISMSRRFKNQAHHRHLISRTRRNRRLKRIINPLPQTRLNRLLRQNRLRSQPILKIHTHQRTVRNLPIRRPVTSTRVHSTRTRNIYKRSHIRQLQLLNRNSTIHHVRRQRLNTLSPNVRYHRKISVTVSRQHEHQRRPRQHQLTTSRHHRRNRNRSSPRPHQPTNHTESPNSQTYVKGNTFSI